MLTLNRFLEPVNLHYIEIVSTFASFHLEFATDCDPRIELSFDQPFLKQALLFTKLWSKMICQGLNITIAGTR